jgi:hypothetical protein
VLLKITSRECSPKLILWLVGIDTSAGSLHWDTVCSEIIDYLVIIYEFPTDKIGEAWSGQILLISQVNHAFSAFMNSIVIMCLAPNEIDFSILCFRYGPATD